MLQKMRFYTRFIVILLIFPLILTLMLSFVQSKEADFPKLKGPYLGQKPPSRTPELFAPHIISTGNQHGSVYFSPDGLEVYFSQMFPQPSLIMHQSVESLPS